MRNHSCQLIIHRIRKGFGSVFLALLTLFFLTGFLPGNLGSVYASAGSIYLDGIHGNDSHDGENASTAVKTFEKAKELATDNQDIETIYILGTETPFLSSPNIMQPRFGISAWTAEEKTAI